jgi:hypothetical protein
LLEDLAVLHQLIAPAIIEAMHKKMPGSQFAKVPGAGHSVYFEKPEEYERLVLAFLQQHAATQPGSRIDGSSGASLNRSRSNRSRVVVVGVDVSNS